MAYPPRILCVDDNEDTREMIELLLGQAGESYSVTMAATAEQALELSKKHRFELYILDYKLPQMSGIEFCRKLRQKGLTMPVMFFTGMSFESHRKKALETGATEYLVKPNDLKKFTQTVRRLLRKDQLTYELNIQSNMNYHNTRP